MVVARAPGRGDVGPTRVTMCAETDYPEAGLLLTYTLMQPTVGPWLLQRFEADDTDQCFAVPWRKPGYINFMVDGVRRYAHHAVCEWANGPRPSPAHHVAHTCGNGKSLGCVNRRHLVWATASENESHKREHGTAPIGQRNPNAMLSEADVVEIIRRVEAGQSQTSVAATYNVTQTTVGRIMNGQRWGAVTGRSGRA
jgi:hypothetical protein